MNSGNIQGLSLSYKIILLGDSSNFDDNEDVGKTTFVKQYIER